MNSGIHSETRRKYIPVGSGTASMLRTVSEQMPEFILLENCTIQLIKNHYSRSQAPFGNADNLQT
jgi:hypothetical protein